MKGWEGIQRREFFFGIKFSRKGPFAIIQEI
jgi:hypothetical protein